MKTDPSEKTQKSPVRARWKHAGIILAIAAVSVIGLDGYFNRWGLVLMLLHWNTLELEGTDGSRWTLTAPGECTVGEIDNPHTLVVFDSLVSYDRPYRQAGLFRLYFRLSDSVSSMLEHVYSTVSAYDSSGEVLSTVEEGGRIYANVKRLLGVDTAGTAKAFPLKSPGMGRAAASDSAPSTPADLAPSAVVQDLSLGTDKDLGKAVTRVLGKSPTVVIGLGLGVVASAGLDLLQGQSYVVLAETDRFRMSDIEVGARVGKWEGKDIDILWIFAPSPEPISPHALPADADSAAVPVAPVPESTPPADSAAPR